MQGDDLGGVEPPVAAVPAQSDNGALFFNIGRGAKVIALLLFFLPWVTVSCAGQELVSMSGYQMATGSISVTNPMTGVSETPPGGGERDIPVIVAAILILASIGATFALKRGQAALVAIGGAAAAAALISYTVFVRVPSEMRSGPAVKGADGSGFNAEQIAEMIKVDVASGFWLTLAALGAAIVLNWLARSRSTP